MNTSPLYLIGALFICCEALADTSLVLLPTVQTSHDSAIKLEDEWGVELDCYGARVSDTEILTTTGCLHELISRTVDNQTVRAISLSGYDYGSIIIPPEYFSLDIQTDSIVQLFLEKPVEAENGFWPPPWQSSARSYYSPLRASDYVSIQVEECYAGICRLENQASSEEGEPFYLDNQLVCIGIKSKRQCLQPSIHRQKRARETTLVCANYTETETEAKLEWHRTDVGLTVEIVSSFVAGAAAISLLWVALLTRPWRQASSQPANRQGVSLHEATAQAASAAAAAAVQAMSSRQVVYEAVGQRLAGSTGGAGIYQGIGSHGLAQPSRDTVAVTIESEPPRPVVPQSPESFL